MIFRHFFPQLCGFNCPVGLDGISMHTILVFPSSCRDKNTFHIRSTTKILDRGTFLQALSSFHDEAIPDICHGHTGQARKKKSVMWRNFKFLYMKDLEKSKISPHVD